MVFATGGGALVDVVRAKGFEHHEIPAIRLEGRSITTTATAVRAMHRLIKRTRPSVVHAYNAHAASCAAPAAKALGAAVFNTVLGRGKERVLRFVPAHFIAVSDFVRQSLMTHGLAGDRITVVPNSAIADDQIADDIELTRLQEARLATQRAGTIELCSVAMFSGSKGQDLIIRVLAELSKRNEANIRVTFVGDGPARAQCESQARASGVAHLCEFVGAQPDVLPYLDRASLFVHLALAETFGLVLAEAGARGLPVVTHHVGGIPEVVSDEVTGIVAPYRSITAAADAIQRLIRTPELQQQIGRQGRDRVRECFRQEISGAHLLDLYQSRGALVR